ncbi:hypothetical protein AB0D49_10585 [Streptomyces sp. NPDC048290]|uniref:hypothetical protein n=1 Tax=Streptomyces sp. NPDC048290 TaxID=3155811 RepID=UPI00342A9FEC
MTLRLPRLLTTTGAAALAVAGLVAMPGTASAAAASECSARQHKEFDTLGVNLDAYITLCVYRDASNDYKATAYVSWADGGQGNSGGMEKFYVQVRVERNDTVYRTNTTNYSNVMNSAGSGSGSNSTPEYRSATTGGWTADGTVTYNIDLDGEGDKTWQLGGSPSI